jgi:2-(1,2-epoxy-1,2-dihydrophenyl)acetyl-CoA isomerase
LGTQIVNAVHEAERDDEVGVIVLTGAGRVFSAGGDINGLIASFDAPKPDEELRVQLAQSASGCLALMDSAKPTIALVNGAAAGGGLAIAAACDIRIAGQSAKFAYAYPRIALAGDLAANWSLMRILGPAKARYFCLTGKILTAAEALKIGLVEEVHADAELMAAGLLLAAAIAAMSPMALAQVKAGLEAACNLPRDAAIAVETANFLIARRHPDHREAAKAFLEKRAPRWGRLRND